MKEYAKDFYRSKAWRNVSKLYMNSKGYVCERCGGVGTICHHKKYITPHNINNPDITLNLDNLECLCQECHNKEHMLQRSRVVFDETGNIEAVKDNKQIAEYKEALKKIEKLMLLKKQP